ncbi:hypothetical protein Tco_0290821 [Tanacetum coccineum]
MVIILHLLDALSCPHPRKKLDSEFIEEENKLEMVMITQKLKIILSQGSSRHIFNILNQTSTAAVSTHQHTRSRDFISNSKLIYNAMHGQDCYCTDSENGLQRWLLDAEAEAFLADVDCTAPYDQPHALTT